MDVAGIISLARNQTWGTTTSQVSDAQMLIYLNIVYQEIFAAIAETSKLQLWERWTADLVADQSEYSLPILDTANSQPWLKRLLQLYIKYSATQTDYYKVQAKTYEALHEWYDFYLDNSNLDEKYPIYVRADENSIFINPAPTEAVTEWLVIQATYTPLDLQLTDAEVDIKLPREYHNILALGLEQYIRWYRQVDTKRSIAMQRYLTEKQKMLSDQWAKTWTGEDELPDGLNWYEW